MVSADGTVIVSARSHRRDKTTVSAFDVATGEVLATQEVEGLLSPLAASCGAPATTW